MVVQPGTVDQLESRRAVLMKTLLGVFSILPGIVDMSFSRKRLNMCATLTGERRETHVPQIPG